MTALRVGVVQHDIVWESRHDNLERLRPKVAAAAASGCRLVVLSEMFSVGFSMRVDVTGETPDGPSTAWLAERAAEHDMWVGGTVPVREAPAQKPFNAFVLAGPAGETYSYRKIHPFTYGGESAVFSAGSDVLTVDIDGVRVTPTVCYDLRFADLYWAAAAKTDLFVVSANWPAARRRHWTALLAARAIENQAYVAGCNRVGSGGGLTYAGDSSVVSPMGEVLVSAAEAETTLVVDVEPSLVADTRQRYPFQADRR
jgi:predicted amidohydrolase